jgi:hypothetical protein
MNVMSQSFQLLRRIAARRPQDNPDDHAIYHVSRLASCNHTAGHNEPYAKYAVNPSLPHFFLPAFYPSEWIFEGLIA